jgi:hypothetical protein
VITTGVLVVLFKRKEGNGGAFGMFIGGLVVNLKI